jgi:iron(III) transport system ATP-binding protein
MESGRVQQVAEPFEIYAHPTNRFVADFIGRVNFLEGRVVAASGGTAGVDVRGHRLEVPLRDATIRPGEPVTLVVRPETIRLAPAATAGSAAFRGAIRRAVYLGATVEYELDWEGTTILAVNGSPLEHGVLAEGAITAFDFPPATAHLLPAAAIRAP